MTTRLFSLITATLFSLIALLHVLRLLRGWQVTSEIGRLIINVPPRSLKSHAATVAFPAYVLGHYPSAQIITASYGQDLSNKHSMDCRTLMVSEWYRGLFPTRLSPHKHLEGTPLASPR
ncbi:MAG TPA: hypothetical protein VK208_15565 [Pyrinomonadaceae bacterium]|nr:hypothetical protein [Pyrinomonadaceae bacterium]